MILSCTCIHIAQDQLHGKGMRVHNLSTKGAGNAPGWRCTICGKVRQANVNVAVKDEKK